MTKIISGMAARIIIGDLKGRSVMVKSVSPILGTARILVDNNDYHISAEYLDQSEFIKTESDYQKWVNDLPDPQQWLEYQISEYNARFEGVNLLNVFDKDDDYKTLVMLRNTLAALKSARSNEEYYKRKYQREHAENSWVRNPDRMGQ